MNTTRILTKAQAEAVYSAMCALNNVNGRINATVIESLRVTEIESGEILVRRPLDEPAEAYANQAAFAAAYGL